MRRNKKILNEKEELDRFKLLMEYDFYIGEEDDYKPEGDLMTEEDPEENELEADLDSGEDFGEEGGEDFGGEEEGGEELEGDIEADLDVEEPMDDAPEDTGGFEDTPEMEEPLPEPEPMEDEVELDVTELVQSSEAAKASADQANQSIDMLMAKFDEMTDSLDRMDAIHTKIDGLEHEIEKRNPTPEEELEMRSLDSFPYNLKLTDYWDEKEGNYDAMNGGIKKEDSKNKEEYVLTQDEVDRDYNKIHVKDSFSGTEKDTFNDDIMY